MLAQIGLIRKFFWPKEAQSKYLGSLGSKIFGLARPMASKNRLDPALICTSYHDLEAGLIYPGPKILKIM